MLTDDDCSKNVTGSGFVEKKLCVNSGPIKLARNLFFTKLNREDKKQNE